MNSKDQHIANLIKQRILTKNPDAQVVLFGSHVRGQATADSDWDILILLNGLKIGRETEKEYREELFELELEIGEPISIFVYSKNEWESKFSMTPVYNNVKKEGVLLT
ncbi:nucleotidyltransferase domain-containing protein [Marinilabilia salmonicolor]|uniref:nucleotidyltransferase domain-containing protein n=1 Tax=Marinilabilia salmonicolor TaxID=989 RepID=UPI000299D6A8|nr:nucleotidyltransferase domain-containing protein [Marinilabilia salmonicolor]